MSDGHDYPNSQHQDWQGGPPFQPPPWMQPDEPPEAGSQAPAHAGSLRDEAEAGYATWAIIAPPLLDASPDRVAACQMAIAMVLLDEGAGMRDAVRFAKRVVERLQEVLE